VSDELGKKGDTFGKHIRAKRMAKKISLRRFADLVGVSPTYLSQVEQDNVLPPTAERVRRMAEILGENVDVLAALAGRMAEDLPTIIQDRPTEMPDLLREASGLTPEQLSQLREQIRRLKEKGGE